MRLILFLWPDQLRYIYDYGSIIKKKENCYVNYQNRLASPGQSIVNWQNSEVTSEFIPSMRLPKMMEREKYRVTINSEMAPLGSIKIAITYFSNGGEIIERRIVSGNFDELIVPAGSTGYKVELISINNFRLEFKFLTIMDSEVYSKYKMKFLEDIPAIQLKSIARKSDELLVKLVHSSVEYFDMIDNHDYLCILADRQQKLSKHIMDYVREKYSGDYKVRMFE